MQKSLALHLAVLCILAASPQFAAAQTTTPQSKPAATLLGTGPQLGVSGQISFYGDIGSVMGSQNPLLVHPSRIFLAEDGSISLDQLHWKGWGLSVARATGIRSASTCMPNCATGKRLQSAARFTLWSPGRVLGHEVYRCFSLTIRSLPKLSDKECIRREGTFYGYSPVSTPAPPSAARS